MVDPRAGEHAALNSLISTLPLSFTKSRA